MTSIRCGLRIVLYEILYCEYILLIMGRLFLVLLLLVHTVLLLPSDFCSTVNHHHHHHHQNCRWYIVSTTTSGEKDPESPETATNANAAKLNRPPIKGDLFLDFGDCNVPVGSNKTEEYKQCY